MAASPVRCRYALIAVVSGCDLQLCVTYSCVLCSTTATFLWELGLSKMFCVRVHLTLLKDISWQNESDFHAGEQVPQPLQRESQAAGFLALDQGMAPGGEDATWGHLKIGVLQAVGTASPSWKCEVPSKQGNVILTEEHTQLSLPALILCLFFPE